MDQDATWCGGSLDPTDIVLDGDPVPLPKRGQSPQFLTRVCCDQTVGWIKMALARKVGLGPGRIVLHGDPAPPSQKERSPQFLAHVYCGQTVVHLSYCWALVVQLTADSPYAYNGRTFAPKIAPSH